MAAEQVNELNDIAEQQTEQHPEEQAQADQPDTPKYMREAMFLAGSYTWMQKWRDTLEKRLSGNWVYTIDMAIEELDSITISYESDRVQSSNISKPTERIALKLTDEYMAKKQAEMDADRVALIKHLDYVNWKIEIVETVWYERMKEMQSAVFTLIFVGHKTYKEAETVIRKKKKKVMVNRNISEIKNQILELFIKELTLRSNCAEQEENIERLMREAEEETHE